MAAAPFSATRSAKSGQDSLFAQVTQRLAVGIVSGELPAGALVPNEESLGTEIVASRTAYREAMRFLAGKGLIEARPRSGTRVAPRSAWHLLDPDVLRWSLAAAANEEFIRDLFELRILIEPGCTALAALRRSEDDLAAIKLAVDGMASTKPYSEANMAHDLAFHAAIFRSSGNAALTSLSDVVATTLLWSLRIQVGRQPQDFVVPLSDHVRIYDAIVRRDASAAETLTRVVVGDALNATLSAFRGKPQRVHPELAVLLSAGE